MDGPPASGLSTWVDGLLGSVLLVVGAAVVWLPLYWVSKRIKCSITDGVGQRSYGLQTVGLLSLAAIVVVAVNNMWTLGLTIVGLFFRPGIGAVLRHAESIAFVFVSFLAGVALGGVNHMYDVGISPVHGAAYSTSSCRA